MGRRVAELAGVLVASIFVSFVTDLATTGANQPVLYIVGALVPLGLLVAYWLWLEPRAEANRVKAIRLHKAIDDAFVLTQPPTETGLPRDGARRDFYDRLELSDLFEPNHIEAAERLGAAHDEGQALRHRLDDTAEPAAALIAELEAWQDRTARIVEVTRGANDATSFRMPTGKMTVTGSEELVASLGTQVTLLELWSGEERKRAGERARERYR